MVQVKGIWRLLTQRFSRDFASRVKYSTLCPSRIDSPSEAIRAMPTSRGLSESGSEGRMDIFYSPFVRYRTADGAPCQSGLGGSIYREKRLRPPLGPDLDRPARSLAGFTLR